MTPTGCPRRPPSMRQKPKTWREGSTCRWMFRGPGFSNWFYTPGRLTAGTYRSQIFERKIIFQNSMVMFHVNLRGYRWCFRFRFMASRCFPKNICHQVELQKMIDTYMTLFLVGANNMNATSVAEVRHASFWFGEVFLWPYRVTPSSAVHH